jgi:PAS domain S-box-containing protein
MHPEPDPPATDVVGSGHPVLDSLPRAIAATDGAGAVVLWNRSAAALTGWTHDDVIGRPLAAVVRDSERDAAEQVVRRALDGERWNGDLMVRRPDGTTVRMAAYIGPLREGDDVVGVVASAEDVTDLRAFERQAAEVADRLALALSAGGLGTWRWDMASGVTTWDVAMERLFGLEPGTFDGTFEAWAALLHPDDRDAVLAEVDRAVAAADSYSVEHRIVRPDGEVRWLLGRGKVMVDTEGRVTGTIGVTGDVTARKLAELEVGRRASAAERLAEVERLQRERLEFLSGLDDAALTAPDHRALMAAVADAAVPALGDWCTVHFVPYPGAPPEVVVAHSDPRKVDWARELQERYPYDPDAPTGIAAVMRSGTTEFLPFIDQRFVEQLMETDQRIEPGELRSILDRLQLTSVITVALTTKQGVVGAMQFVSAESGRRYDDADVALAEAAAGRVAQALENAWRGDQHQTIAATLQSSLLPPSLPTVEGLGVAVRYWAAGAANEVGGDFYDVFPVSPDRWAVVIGDVCGTGPEAAAVTAIARHTIRAAATHGADHREVLRWLNDAIIAGNRHRFCTVVYATLERTVDDRWTCTLVAGGHPLPIRVDRDGAAAAIGTPGTLVGILPEVRVTPVTVVLDPGDTVVLYTDGVTDVPPPHQLDEEAVVALVVDAAAADTADGVADRLGTAIEDHLALRDRADDVALVALRVAEPGA